VKHCQVCAEFPSGPQDRPKGVLSRKRWRREMPSLLAPSAWLPSDCDALATLGAARVDDRAARSPSSSARGKPWVFLRWAVDGWKVRFMWRRSGLRRDGGEKQESITDSSTKRHG
jgi:hypothetical protein